MSQTEEITTESSQNSRKVPQFYGKTLQAAKLVMDHGVEPKEALILASGNKQPTRQAVHHFKEKLNKLALSSPKMQKLARSAIQETLEMKPIDIGEGKQMFPSHTNRLAAAAMVADRVDPVIRTNLNINAEVDAPIDVDALRGLFNCD